MIDHFLADEIWLAIQEYLPEPERGLVAQRIIETFEEHGVQMDTTEVYNQAFPIISNDSETAD